MKYTLLDLVQTLLSSLDGGEINSISDTEEAQQIVRIIRSTYFDIVDKADLSSQYTVFNLTASDNPSQPTLMSLPGNIANLSWIKYNKETVENPEIDMADLSPMNFLDFSESMYGLNTSDDNVISYVYTTPEGNSLTILGTNDAGPSKYTSFDDGTVIFDSYDASVDTTLQSSKTMAYGRRVVTWVSSDLFTPPLDDKQFALLLNESKSLAFAEMKQMTHAKAEQNAHRGWVSLQRNKTKLELQSNFDRLPNFGRK